MKNKIVVIKLRKISFKCCIIGLLIAICISRKIIVSKIIETSTNANDKSYSMDDLPEYELYLGEKYVQKYDTMIFVVEKEQINNYLDELLEQLDVDLNSCANPDYVK